MDRNNRTTLGKTGANSQAVLDEEYWFFWSRERLIIKFARQDGS
jgi:hypothetical protein